MLSSIDSFLNIVYYILLIILTLILILEVLYPGWSFWDFFPSKSKGPLDEKFKDEKDEFEAKPSDKSSHKSVPEEDILSIESGSNSESVQDYKKYDQNFKLEGIDSAKIITNDDQITFNDLINLIKDDSFIDDCYNSIHDSLEYKLELYNKEKTKVSNDLRLSRKKSSNVTGTHDSNIELLTLWEKELDDILICIADRMKKLNRKEIRKSFRQMIHNPEYGFDSIIGHSDVKDVIAKRIYTFIKNPKVFMNNFQNYRFYGNSGVGKSKLAETIGFIYCKSYILVRRRYRDYTAKDFTSQYVSESPRLTFKLLLAGLEGVIFIDEAYGLATRSLLHNHTEEAVTEMVNFIDKHTGQSVIMIAGYENEMQKLLESNEGLERRFPYLYILKDYSSKELTSILIKFLKKSAPDLEISDRDSNVIYTYIEFVYSQSKQIFEKQAGSMKILSGYILEAIYNSKNYEWLPGKENLKARAYLILSGFNCYLRPYRITITV